MVTGIDRIQPEFVELMPSTVTPGILYVSIPFNTAVHLCCCGCGNRVVTPLAPAQWRLIYNGRDISLYPSIGNWSYPCQSHYWIDEGAVQWAPTWSKRQIEAGRSATRKALEADLTDENPSPEGSAKPKHDAPRRTEDWGIWNFVRAQVGRSSQRREE